MSQQYNLNISPSSLSNGDLKEVEIPGLANQEVLLSKVNDRIYATSPRCTHYGAPLSKGVLSPNGRVICPWHGACFRVDTGDIEDAPALDALQSYPVTIIDDSVHITASPTAIQAGRRLPTHCAPSTVQITDAKEHVVIIGGGSGAMGAMEGLRDFGFIGSITVLSKEHYRPVDRTKLSKSLLTDLSKLQWRSDQFYKDLKIDLKLSTVVKSVDFQQKVVKTESGESFPYSRLILATGGTPRRFTLPGFDLPNVFLLREVGHAEQINKALGEGAKKVVIIGSSFIGMELAACLIRKKHDVTVIGMEKYPFEAILGTKIGEALLNLHTTSGVKFKLSASVEKISAEDGTANAVVLKGGEAIPAEVVILGTGVSPATEYLRTSAGVELEKDGGVRVDQYMRLERYQDVYAIGDIAHFPYIGHTGGAKGQHVRIEHWDVAMNQGRTAARHITSIGDPSSVMKELASKAIPFTNVPYFWSAQGQNIRYCGHAGRLDSSTDVIIQGSFEEKKWAGFFIKGDEVVAVISMGYDPVVSKSAELMRSGEMPRAEELRNGLDVRTIKAVKGPVA